MTAPDSPLAARKLQKRSSVRPTFRPAAMAATISGAPKEPSDAPPSIFKVGDVIADIYEVRSLLGQGGMAQVYEVQDRQLSRRVALKAALPDPHLPSLITEARALAAFSHPSLVTVHSVGHFRGIEYIVMERIYGMSLAEHIRKRRAIGKRFEVYEVVELLHQLAEGLTVVHRAGVAHRDIKPGNVMLTPDHRTVLMDFGLMLPNDEANLPNMIAGSPPYMPAEALTNSIVGERAPLVDIYALGVIGFEMLMGRWPFWANTLPELWQQLQKQQIPDIASVRDDVPRRIAKLISAMLAFRVEDRPQSAEAVAWITRSLLSETDSIRPARQLPSRPPVEHEVDVLIVEDDDDIARIIEFYVTQAMGDAVAVRRAVDGVEAIEKIADREPHLMLLDLHMPRMNGIEVCMQLRGDRLAEDMMIVAVSAGAQEHDLQLLHQFGLHHFILKGADLKEQIRKVLRVHWSEFMRDE